MKTTLFIFLFFTFLNVYSQDTAKMKQIDLLVAIINASTLPARRDTINQDHPDVGLKMTTFLTMIREGTELKKYVNHVNTTMTENGNIREMTTSSSFYYHQNKLVKVEEFLVEGDSKKQANWYYSEDSPLYNPSLDDKAKAQAALLLTLSKAMLKQVVK